MISTLRSFIINFKQRYVIQDLELETNFDASLVSINDSTSYISQQYNQISAAIVNNKILKKSQTIIFSSAQPADGKSTTVANVAIKLAREHDKKVLVIDADWRRPNQQNLFRQENLVVTDFEIEDQKFIYSSGIENLELLLFSPEKIVGTQWLDFLKENISDLKSEYDLILIDTAPILKVTDAAELNSVSDALLLVVKAQDTSSGIISNAIENFKNIDVEVTATILVNTPNYVDVYNYILNPHYRKYYSNYYSEY